MRFVSKFDNFQHMIHPGVTAWQLGAGGVQIQVVTAPHLVAEFERGVLGLVEREAARQYFDGRDSSANAGEQPGAYRHDGVFVATEGSNFGEADGMSYSGSKHEFFYGLFDTEDEAKCPPEYRAAFEAVLSADKAACARVSEELGFLGTSALRPTTDIRGGDLVCLEELLKERRAIETPDGGFIVTGEGSGPAAEPAPAVIEAPWKPWAKYDEIAGPTSAKDIAQVVGLTGTDPERTARYEALNKNRPSVIAILVGCTVAEAKTWADGIKLADAPVVIHEDAEPVPSLQPFGANVG